MMAALVLMTALQGDPAICPMEDFAEYRECEIRRSIRGVTEAVGELRDILEDIQGDQAVKRENRLTTLEGAVATNTWLVRLTMTTIVAGILKMILDKVRSS